MKVFAISDWHLSINNPKPMDIFGGAWENYLEELSNNLNMVLEDDSILLIAGDISWAMQLEQVRPDLEFISKFKGKKIILRGNHDYWWKSISSVRNIAGKSIFALQNDSVKIGDIVIAGSRGWSIPQSNDAKNEKIYNREILRIKMSLNDAAKKRKDNDKLIIMTHYPPFIGTAANTPVTQAITAAGADAVIYGHIHSKISKSSQSLRKRQLLRSDTYPQICTTINGIPYYLTSCDILNNKPLRIF